MCVSCVVFVCACDDVYVFSLVLHSCFVCVWLCVIMCVSFSICDSCEGVCVCV